MIVQQLVLLAMPLLCLLPHVGERRYEETATSVVACPTNGELQNYTLVVGVTAIFNLTIQENWTVMIWNRLLKYAW